MSDHEDLDAAVQKPPTMRDVALRCGVSQATVSMALRNDKRLEKSTVERVVNAAREMGYDPMRYMAARRLISRRHGHTVLNNVIGLFFYHKDFGESNYFVRLFQGILRTITEVDFEIQTSDTATVPPPYQLPGAYRKGDIDGALVMSDSSGFLPIMKELRSEPSFGNNPLVNLIEHTDGCSGVYPDNYAAGRAAIGHLLDLGHRKLIVNAAQDPEGHNVLGQRIRAYRDTCRERNLDSAKSLTEMSWDMGVVKESCERLMAVIKQHPDATAIIASNDIDAANIYDYLSGQGYRIPSDISLVSYDDTDPIIGPNRENILTSVRLPLREVGEEGARLLIRRILGEETEDRDTIMPIELIVRESTARPR